jgi:PIN domain nuclease of toxin-antitoxin system
MKYLLDTHTLLWTLDSPQKLSRQAYEIVSGKESKLYVSIATPWELAIKANRGGLEIDDLLNSFESTLSSAGYELLETRTSHVIRGGLLPLHHRDPFDRLLIAQSIEEGLALVSCDEVFDLYGVKRIWR